MQANSPTEPLSMRELAEVLIRHHGLHEGIYDTAIEFQFALGQVGPDPQKPMPGAMLGVSRIGLVKVNNAGPQSVDAAKVNPLKKSRAKPKD